MRVLVLGSGGREHALVRALARDPDVTALHAAPGNPGIAQIAETHAVTATDPGQVTALAARLGADLVVIGPEAPLVAGVADAVRAAGLRLLRAGPGGRDDRGLEVVRQAGHDRGRDPHRGGQDLPRPRPRSARPWTRSGRRTW